ncbi:hypothetical protein MJO28_009849 [Puccinia striiformis f. sp. tritici]|uniref:Uncharacterized protein n=1 Tax=Puccinia striiformis f. sp. tritici TaxID=168172 RepID=A0ACC0E898_9BASI|nr:hypothetical protein MJO28_009849 [Puccinia striiformis f. sp. tritici]
MAVHITRFNQFSLVYGVKDTINTRFITESWTNPLLKEKMEALDEHYPVWLYNPIMKLEDVINHGSAGDFPSVAQSKVREAAVEMVPEDITRFNNAQPRRGEILQVGEIRLSLHDTICSGVFIVVDAFYEMRQISRTTNHAVVNTKDVMGSINVQHNCQFGRCVIRPTKPVQLERQPTNILTPEVGHTDDGHFVINVAVLHNPALHCLVSDLPGQGLTARGWVECVNHGFSVWAQVPDEPADILDTTASEALQ